MSIYQKRVAAGITQEELATKLGVDRSTVTKWETGQSLPRTHLLPKLAELFGCTVDELLGIEKTPSRAD